MSLYQQRGTTPIIAFFVIGLVTVTLGAVLYVGNRDPDELSPSPSIISEPSPSIEVSPTPVTSPTAPANTLVIDDQLVTSETVTIQTPKPSPTTEVFIEKIKTEKENGRVKITLEGRKFGSIKNQILLDNSVHNYGYDIITWNDNHVEFYGSQWMPTDKNVSVAIISNSGDKSNTVSFFNSK